MYPHRFLLHYCTKLRRIVLLMVAAAISFILFLGVDGGNGSGGSFLPAQIRYRNLPEASSTRRRHSSRGLRKGQAASKRSSERTPSERVSKAVNAAPAEHDPARTVLSLPSFETPIRTFEGKEPQLLPELKKTTPKDKSWFSSEYNEEVWADILGDTRMHYEIAAANNLCEDYGNKGSWFLSSSDTTFRHYGYPLSDRRGRGYRERAHHGLLGTTSSGNSFFKKLEAGTTIAGTNAGLYRSYIDHLSKYLCPRMAEKGWACPVSYTGDLADYMVIQSGTMSPEIYFPLSKLLLNSNNPFNTGHVKVEYNCRPYEAFGNLPQKDTPPKCDTDTPPTVEHIVAVRGDSKEVAAILKLSGKSIQFDGGLHREHVLTPFLDSVHLFFGGISTPFTVCDSLSVRILRGSAMPRELSLFFSTVAMFNAKDFKNLVPFEKRIQSCFDKSVPDEFYAYTNEAIEAAGDVNDESGVPIIPLVSKLESSSKLREYVFDVDPPSERSGLILHNPNGEVFDFIDRQLSSGLAQFFDNVHHLLIALMAIHGNDIFHNHLDGNVFAHKEHETADNKCTFHFEEFKFLGLHISASSVGEQSKRMKERRQMMSSDGSYGIRLIWKVICVTLGYAVGEKQVQLRSILAETHHLCEKIKTDMNNELTLQRLRSPSPVDVEYFDRALCDLLLDADNSPSGFDCSQMEFPGRPIRKREKYKRPTMGPFIF